jgi:excisionase family DNA binding protein
LLRVEEAAHMLSLSRKTVYDLLRRGELTSLKIGGSRRIPVTALQDLIARLEAA